MAYIWKYKALRPNGKIAAGMEAEVIHTSKGAPPPNPKIQEAFEQKYNIKAPGGIYQGSGFLVTKPS